MYSAPSTASRLEVFLGPFSRPLSPAEYMVLELRPSRQYNGREAEPTGRGAAGAWVSLGFKQLGPGCRRTNSAVAIAYESYCIHRLREQRLVEECGLSEQTTKRGQAGAAVQRRQEGASRGCCSKTPLPAHGMTA